MWRPINIAGSLLLLMNLAFFFTSGDRTTARQNEIVRISAKILLPELPDSEVHRLEKVLLGVALDQANDNDNLAGSQYAETFILPDNIQHFTINPTQQHFTKQVLLSEIDLPPPAKIRSFGT
jgi:hypothetical protein